MQKKQHVSKSKLMLKKEVLTKLNLTSLSLFKGGKNNSLSPVVGFGTGNSQGRNACVPNSL